ncbi:hypothetical protein CPB85DRAFT_1291026, partial [Mucidula mucida]
AEDVAVLEHLAREDQNLLFRRYTILGLYCSFDIVSGVGRFDVDVNGSARDAIARSGKDYKVKDIPHVFMKSSIVRTPGCGQ